MSRRIFVFVVAAFLLVFSSGRLLMSSAIAGPGSVTYTYDEAGRLKATTYSNSASTTYSLDAPGNRKLVQTTPAPALPSAPGVPTFTNITATTATVSWAASTGVVASYSYSVNSGAWVNVGTARTASLSGLTTATTYSVAVIATNASGNGPSSSASFMTLPPLPGAPGVPTFSNITLTSATVSWTAASGTVTSYSYSLNSGAWINVGTALSANLSGLTAGTAYTVKVLATNLSGNGVASSASFTTPTLPGAPGIPSFTNITQTTATASWTAASGSVTSYSYSVNSGAWTNVGTALSANLTGLTAGTSYSVQVLATNASGNSAPSTASFSTLPPPPSAPGTPSFTSITTTTATASWTAASGTVASYSYSVNSGAWTNVGTALSANLTGLTGGTTYTVQVIATNPGGNGPASSASFTTLPPPPSAPGVPSFTNVTPNTATVSWAAASGTVTSYSYSVNSGGWINVGTALSAGLSGLSASTTYTVQVVATNSSGNGPASSASFTTSSTYSDTPTMTEGNTTPTGTGGFLSGSFGSMSPATTTNGYTYTSLYDKWAGGMAQTYSFSAFSVAGFSADPGQGWLTSATAQGVTFTGASATYSYASGTATWTWTPLNGFGFNGTGTTVCIIVHK
jgi:YD repeat-containing protein